MGAVVVYVHGLWLPGGESFLLRRRLSRALGAESRVFSYPSVRGNITESAEALGRYLQKIPADTLHLVAHSMGGLLILKLFELGVVTGGPVAAMAGPLPAPPLPAGGVVLPPGRIVLTGSPVRGSESARRLVRAPFGFGRVLLGRVAAEALLSRGERQWTGGRDLGVIAGEMGVGLGRLLGRLEGPNDGTVLVEETDLPGATDQLRLRVSHSGMVYSPEVARQIAVFLREGRFERRA
jgi:pimeloyl-ACP methyl ester carboxylesterase